MSFLLSFYCLTDCNYYFPFFFLFIDYEGSLLLYVSDLDWIFAFLELMIIGFFSFYFNGHWQMHWHYHSTLTLWSIFVSFSTQYAPCSRNSYCPNIWVVLMTPGCMVWLFCLLSYCMHWLLSIVIHDSFAPNVCLI